MPQELEQSLTADGVLTLTMNRPEVHNAFDDHQIARMTSALQDAQSNPAVRVIVIASNGKNFSAGGDINYMRRMGENSYADNLADGAKLALLMKTLNEAARPTIARVQGAAMGGGVGLVSCCDFAIGTPNTRLALSEVKLGMIPATISPYVVMTIGEKAARRLFLSATPVQGEAARAIGFLSDVVPEETLDSAVASLAASLLANAPQALGLAKELASKVANVEISDALIEETVELIARVRDSSEGREGLSAFLEKRPPTWQ
ncbi:MAG: enoyl-CoA hydratase-related protein [Pseudomonadota bacterium]